MNSRLIGVTVCLFYTVVFAVLTLNFVGCGGDDGDLGLTGAAGKDGANGNSGSNGTSGANGTNGANGTSCSAVTVAAGLVAPNGGALITCGSTTVLLLNGEPGPQGVAGPTSPYAIVEIIDPCGDTAGIYDEVLLRTYNGRIIASFSDNANGQNTRLSEITAGSYVTTDASNCHFNVSSTGVVTW